MLDGFARKLIDPPLNLLGAKLAEQGVTANQMTTLGLVLGLLGCVAIAVGWMVLAFVLIIVSRVADGLDGAIARARTGTDFGGYYDIVADFLFYGAVPFAFAILDPSANALAAAFVTLSFLFNGTTFLGFAIIAERRKLETNMRGQKNFYFADGLMEGSETILFILLIVIIPSWFFWAAIIFGTAAFLTGILRVFQARAVFTDT